MSCQETMMARLQGGKSGKDVDVMTSDELYEEKPNWCTITEIGKAGYGYGMQFKVVIIHKNRRKQKAEWELSSPTKIHFLQCGH